MVAEAVEVGAVDRQRSNVAAASSRPTDVQLTSMSAGSAADVDRAHAELGGERARALGRPVPDPTSAAPASRSAQTTARALPPAPRTSAVRPRRRLAAARRAGPARRCCRPRSRRRPNVSVLAAPIARARARRLVRERERGLLVRDRHVGAARSRRRGSARHGLGEQLGRDGQQLVAPVDSRARRSRVVHRRRAAVGDRPAEDAVARLGRLSSPGDLPPAFARACVVGGDVALELRVGRARTRARRCRTA